MLFLRESLSSWCWLTVFIYMDSSEEEHDQCPTGHICDWASPWNRAWQTAVLRLNPACHLFLYSLRSRNDSYIFKRLKRNKKDNMEWSLKKRSSLWKLYGIQNLMSINKILLGHNKTPSYMYCLCLLSGYYGKTESLSLTLYDPGNLKYLLSGSL